MLRRISAVSQRGWDRPLFCAGYRPGSRHPSRSKLRHKGQELAQRKNGTPAQIALAWLLAQKPWIVPIPGTTKLSRLDENVGAVSVELTSEDLREIESAASNITIQGARYPEALEKRTGL